MNQVHKVAMHLVKWRGDLTLQVMAINFWMKTYGEVGWACTHVRAKKTTDLFFKNRVEQVEAFIGQQKI